MCSVLKEYSDILNQNELSHCGNPSRGLWRRAPMMNADTASETSQGTLIKTNAQSFSTVCQVFVEEK